MKKLLWVGVALGAMSASMAYAGIFDAHTEAHTENTQSTLKTSPPAPDYQQAKQDFVATYSVS